MKAAVAKAPKRTRALVREKDRQIAKLGQKIDRLVMQAVGGTPERSIPVTSASVVEIKARAMRCAHCEGELQLLAHEAEFLHGAQLRRVDMKCKTCFTARRIWFALGPAAN
ncbi:MAG: hypothetical protein SF187_12450 [Deltaproteobacteria bacterium]|nr:hypothetical protein [Deltaproteobacteria bacterium]